MTTRKYNNGRMFMRAPGGRFAVAPTLEQLGFPVNSTSAVLTCGRCGHRQVPLLSRGWVCAKCESINPVEVV